ncbi:ribosomal lysine N-methyltransferase [Naviculisporaceae sp. PSN 640]
MDMELDGGYQVDFSQATDTFLNWFKSLPGASFHEDIKIEDFRGKNAGRGIVATKPIEPETVLFTIPRQSIISTSTSDLPTLLPEVFKQPDPSEEDSESEENESSYPPKQDPWTSLILILLYEHFRGDSSKWAPYLSILPTEFDTPMFWTPSEISNLQASALVSKIGKDEADAMIRSKILPVVRANPTIFWPASSSPPSDQEIISLSHKMGSTIMAYAFDLEKDTPESDQAGGEEEEEQDPEDSWIEDREAMDGKHQQQMGMVPMADMLNADAEFNAFINHDSPEALTAVAIRRIEPGEEILNYYGPLASSELLRRYGYVTEKHSRYDVVELPWELVAKHIKQKLASMGVDDKVWQKVHEKIEKDQEFDMEEAFVLERQSEDPDSEGRVHGEAAFNALPEELSEQVKYVLKIVKKVAAGRDIEKLSDKDVRNEMYLDSVLKALKERLEQYATSVEEDEKLLNANNGESRRLLMAVWVRMGEKKLLREAQTWVAEKLEEVKAKIPSTTTSTKRSAGGDEPSAKRRRG